MAKFKVKLKITGFEMEVEGDRDDAAAISQGIASQFGSLMKPAAEIIDGEVSDHRALPSLAAPGISSEFRRRSQESGAPARVLRRRLRRGSSSV